MVLPQQGLLDGVRADLDSGHGVADFSAGRRWTRHSREEEDFHRESHGGMQHDDGDDEQADGLVVTLDVSRGLDGVPYRCQDRVDVANAAASAGKSAKRPTGHTESSQSSPPPLRPMPTAESPPG